MVRLGLLLFERDCEMLAIMGVGGASGMTWLTVD